MQTELDGIEQQPDPAKLQVKNMGTGKRLVPVFADVLADVSVELVVRLGSGTVTIKELLGFKLGATIALDMPLNGVVDVYLKDAVVARGEIVAVGDYYGVKLTEVAELDL